MLFVAFQPTFAGITVALVVGSFAERTNLCGAGVRVVWFTFAYLPIAHMVWFWPGPDGYTSRQRWPPIPRGGWLWQLGAIDFAGGTVVHINSGVAALVGACVGKRVGYGKNRWRRIAWRCP